MIKLKATFSGSNISGFLTVFLLIFALFLTGCFSPFKEDEMGVISINLGGGDARSAMPWPSGGEDGDEILDYLDFEITLTGPGPTQTLTAKSTDTNIKATVAAGLWTVKIDAYLEGYETLLTPGNEKIHYATGSERVDVKAGQSNPVSIKMKEAFDLTILPDGTKEKPFLVTQTTIFYVGKGDDNPEGPEGYYKKWDLDAHYKLMIDITLAVPTDGESNWKPIGTWDEDDDDNKNPFTGVFDGGGKKISNFTIIASGSNYQGLFGYIGAGAEVKNLILDNVDITGNDWVGGIVGKNTGTVQDCSVINSNVKGGDWVGGIAGVNENGTVENCSVIDSSIEGIESVGGIAGWNEDSIVENCSVINSTVEGRESVGGIAGYSGPPEDSDKKTIVRSCYVSGDDGFVIGDYYVGGVVGLNNDGLVQKCYTTVDVDGEYSVGGIVGYSTSFSTSNNNLVENCFATGNITGDNNVGGVVGDNYGGDVKNCYATGDITAERNNAGGVVGSNTGLIEFCYATGDVVIDEDSSETDIWAGGVVGGGGLCFVDSCVALNPSVGTNAANAGRVAGKEDHVYVTNSYARADMLVNGNPVTDGAADDEDGAGITATSLNSADWWKETAEFDVNVWEFSNGKLPTLKGVGGTQDPKVNIPDGKSANNPFHVYQANIGYVGGKGDLSDEYYQTWTLSAHYKLMSDITLDGNWTPIGTTSNAFTGTFDGGGNVIRNLSINDQSTLDPTGLFGSIGGEVKNLGLVNVDIKGNEWVGSISGHNSGTIQNCYSTGDITGTNYVGGVVGMNITGGTVQNCYATSDIIANVQVGGVAGTNAGGTVQNCYSTGNVTGDSAGGVVGWNGDGGTVRNCVALNMTITGNDPLGRVVGEHITGFLTNNHALGEMSVDGNREFDFSGPNDKDGKDVFNTVNNGWKYADWWQNSAPNGPTFSPVVWDFSNVGTNDELPFLHGFEEPQNPVVKF